MDFDTGLCNVGLEVLMEREDEMMCDISLYNEQIIRLQMSLQKKEMTVTEYNNDYEILSSKVARLNESLKIISKEINIRIKDYDDGDLGIDEMDNEQFVESFLDDYGYNTGVEEYND